jgi:hypothetical protein
MAPTSWATVHNDALWRPVYTERWDNADVDPEDRAAPLRFFLAARLSNRTQSAALASWVSVLKLL